jgi:hypothetical protein
MRCVVTSVRCINIGAFFQLATTYAEHDIGFWLAYLLPGIIYMCVSLFTTQWHIQPLLM